MDRFGAWLNLSKTVQWDLSFKDKSFFDFQVDGQLLLIARYIYSKWWKVYAVCRLTSQKNGL